MSIKRAAEEEEEEKEKYDQVR
jgi:hypothetical protein